MSAACTRCLFTAGMRIWLEGRALPQRLRTITIDDDGVCNVCRAFVDERDPLTDLLTREVIETDLRAHGCVVAYSGGKDSTATLAIAARMAAAGGGRVVACLYDNGFIPAPVVDQARAVCHRLDVELVVADDAADQRAFRGVVDAVDADAASPCERCADALGAAALRLCDERGLANIVTGSTYWASWIDAPVPTAGFTSPGGRAVSVVHVPYLLGLTRDDARSLLHEVGFTPHALRGVSTNCRVPGLVQDRVATTIGHVPELEDLSLEVIAGHVSRAEALAELAAKAPEHRALLAIVR